MSLTAENLAREQAEVEELNTELDACKESLEVANEENERLVLEIAAQKEASIGEICNLQEKNVSLESTIALTAETLADSEENSAHKVESLEKQLKASVRNVENTAMQVAKKSKEISSLETKIKALEADAAAADTTADSSVSDANDLENERMSNEIKENNAAIKSLDGEVSTLNAEKAKWEKQCWRLARWESQSKNKVLDLEKKAKDASRASATEDLELENSALRKYLIDRVNLMVSKK